MQIEREKERETKGKEEPKNNVERKEKGRNTEASC